MAWQYDESGITYDEVGLQYDSGVLVTIKRYYTGGIALAKTLLKRGLGF